MNAEYLHVVDEHFMQGAFKAVHDRLRGSLSKDSAEALRKVSMGMEVDPFANMSLEEATLVKQAFDRLSNHLQNVINMQTAAMANGAGLADAAMAGDMAMMDPNMMVDPNGMPMDPNMMVDPNGMPVDPNMAPQGAPVLDNQIPMV